ncbi:MAG: hypothetical protein JNK74_24600 [Candidatus Hydrogenedentes bacterium]|nr:hypothetical protein [Candidatus Hydrogenedentota bacterium]
MSLRFRILFPSVLVLCGAGVLTYFAVLSTVRGLIDVQVESARHASDRRIFANASTKIAQYETYKSAIEDRALQIASLFTEVPVVQDAYRLAGQGNMDDENDPSCQSARELLRTALGPYVAGYCARTGLPELQLHFHLPTERSLVRLWQKGWQIVRDGQKLDVSDDISGFRETIGDARSTGKSVKGMEIGRGGFALRGVCPIVAGDGTILGTNEIIFSFTPLLDLLKESESNELATYMETKYLDIAPKLADETLYPRVGESFVRCASTNDELLGQLVTPSILQDGLAGRVSETAGHWNLTAFPVIDYSGRPVGVNLLAQNVSEFQASVKNVEAQGNAALRRLNWGIAGGSALIVALLAAVLSYIVLGVSMGVRSIAHDLILASVEIEDASDALSGAGRRIAEGASEQSACAEKTSEALRRITNISEQNARGADRAVHCARTAQNTAKACQEEMSRLTCAVNDIQTASEKTATIVRSINDIAHQTNLLALNAAVEAARAGAAGAGFAVVADEVRNLALRSEAAAKDTADMIERVRGSARTGVEVHGDVAAHLQQIGGATDEVEAIVAEVGSMSRLQLEGIREINVVLSEMSDIVHQYAGNSEKSAAASETLSGQARQLEDLVEDLTHLVEGRPARVSPEGLSTPVRA